ncbi:hypothetical protein K32_03250 [Kaistia sp. 32K]|nr:hypothetical protein K32_03250 [Kaistia sp. 32K]
MPVPAISQAMMAPNGPVAEPNRPGRLKIPAPTIEPTTIAVNAPRDSFPVVADAISFPPRMQQARNSYALFARGRHEQGVPSLVKSYHCAGSFLFHSIMPAHSRSDNAGLRPILPKP